MIPQDLMNSVIASPNDDLPRLVAADWLEENGEPEVAEFIRDQINNAHGIYHIITLVSNRYGGYNFDYYPSNPELCGKATAFFMKMLPRFSDHTFIDFQRGFPNKVRSLFPLEKRLCEEVFSKWPVESINGKKRKTKKATNP